MHRWFVGLAASALLMLAALFPSTSQARIDFTVSSETSSTHACSAPAVRWNMLMRFWPQAEGDMSFFGILPSAEDLRPLVEESRADFVTYSDCVVDLTIDGLLKSNDYLPGKDNGASAYAGTYDIVWDIYGSLRSGVGGRGACAQMSRGFPGHAESVELICPGAPQFWVPWGTLLTHEWWHEAVEHTLPALGVQRPLPEMHKFYDYGYPASYEGVVQFYNDMFAGKLTPDGRIRGPSTAEWAFGTNRTAYELGGGGGGGGDACEKAKVKLMKAKQGLRWARKRLRHAKRDGTNTQVAKAKMKVKKAEKRVRKARQAVKRECE